MGELSSSFSAGDRMRYRYHYRSTRSASPDLNLNRVTYIKDGFSKHVDNIIRQSRANSEKRDAEFREEFEEQLKYVHPDIRYATLLCNSLSPWSKTGAFYYPRYPEGWRGTASCATPLHGEYVYWTRPARYYRYQTYYPRYRYTPRYRSRFYR